MLAQPRRRQLLLRHPEKTLNRGATLVATGKTDPQLRFERLGRSRQIGRPGGKGLGPFVGGLRPDPPLLHLLEIEGLADRRKKLVRAQTFLADQPDQFGVPAADRTRHVDQIPQSFDRPETTRLGVAAPEDHREALADRLRALVVKPDLERFAQHVARHRPAAARLTEVDQGQGPFRFDFPQLLAGLADVAFPAFLQLVLLGARVRIAHLPETADEGVALVVLAQGKENLLLLGADQDFDRPQEILVTFRQGATCAGRIGRWRWRWRRLGRGRPRRQAGEQQHEAGERQDPTATLRQRRARPDQG